MMFHLKTLYRFCLIIALAVMQSSCKKDNYGPQCSNCSNNSNSIEGNVLVLNEGNFGWGNASISLYNDSTKTVTHNVFQQKNGTVLGDVAQSAYQIDSIIYLVINNSSKVEVINNNLESIATISGFVSPRYFLPVSATKAYVTDLYANAIQIVDLENNNIIGSITTNGWTEQLSLVNDIVYCCNYSSSNLLVIDPLMDLIIDSIALGAHPNSIAIDANNKIWILCEGNVSNNIKPQLIQFDPERKQIMTSLTFPENDSPSELTIDDSRLTLYYLNQGVYKYSISDTSLPLYPIIESNETNFYGLFVHSNNDVYVADAKDYNQNGSVHRYLSSGVLIDQFNTGIIPGAFISIR